MANENHADFTPTIPDSHVTPEKAPYVPVGSFKFWAQKVLPNVYDDSLSYYEVLTKLVWHINKMIEDMDNFNQSIESTNQSFGALQTYVNTVKTALVETYNELQGYVNHYFDNLDVQDEINHKLDTMAINGTLSDLLMPYVPDLVTQWLNDNITPTSPAIDKTLSVEGAGADALATGMVRNTIAYNIKSLNSDNGFGEIDVSTYKTIPYYLDNGYWRSSQYNGVIIPVENLGDKVKFDAFGYHCYYAFLTSDIITEGAGAAFCAGTTAVDIPVGKQAIVNVPWDCKYMYLQKATNQYMNYHVYSHINVFSLREICDTFDTDYVDKKYKPFEILYGYYTSEAGAIVANDQYDTYVYKTDKDCDIYFSDESVLSIYTSFIAYSTNTYDNAHRLFTRLRYTASENTLPTYDSRKAIPINSYIAISIPKEQDFHMFGYKRKLFFDEYVDINGIQNEKIGELIYKSEPNGYVTKNSQHYELLESFYTTEAGGLTANDGYNTYVFLADRNMDLWFGEVETLSTYVSIIAYTDNIYDNEHRLFTRLRYQANTEDTLPREATPVHILRGQFVAVSIPKTNDFHMYGMSVKKTLNDNIEFNNNQITKIIEIAGGGSNGNTSYVRYETETTSESSSEELAIYVPVSNGYLKYRFVHTVYPGRNANVWRMGMFDLTDSDFNTILPLSYSGEWECALKLNGRSDFSGGYAHGDEIQSSLIVLLDGKTYSPNSLSNITPFTELRLITTSTLYDPNDSTTIIATHGCERIFKNGKIYFNQTINWLHDETLDACYLCMFPPARASNGVAITSNYYTDADYVNKVIPNPVARVISNVKACTLFSEYGFRGSVRVLDYPTDENYVDNGKAIISDNGGQNYNKLYFIVANSGSVSNGDVWKSRTVYDIQYNNN